MVYRLHQGGERPAKGRLLPQPYKLLIPPAELPGKGLQRIMAPAFRAPDIIDTPFAAVIATGCLVAALGYEPLNTGIRRVIGIAKEGHRCAKLVFQHSFGTSNFVSHLLIVSAGR